jgi:hypothetical protein
MWSEKDRRGLPEGREVRLPHPQIVQFRPRLCEGGQDSCAGLAASDFRVHPSEARHAYFFARRRVVDNPDDPATFQSFQPRYTLERTFLSRIFALPGILMT